MPCTLITRDDNKWQLFCVVFSIPAELLYYGIFLLLIQLKTTTKTIWFPRIVLPAWSLSLLLLFYYSKLIMFLYVNSHTQTVAFHIYSDYFRLNLIRNYIGGRNDQV